MKKMDLIIILPVFSYYINICHFFLILSKKSKNFVNFFEQIKLIFLVFFQFLVFFNHTKDHK